jgi:hypothetical protein
VTLANRDTAPVGSSSGLPSTLPASNLSVIDTATLGLYHAARVPPSAHRAALIVRATLRAYETAIADGVDEEAAFRIASAIYRLGYPRTPESIVRQMVAVIVRRPPPGQGRSRTTDRAEHDQTARKGRRERRALPEREVAAAKLAYIRAIADGATPAVAFEVAKAAFRARRPEFSGERLDDAVARALATDEET